MQIKKFVVSAFFIALPIGYIYNRDKIYDMIIDTKKVNQQGVKPLSSKALKLFTFEGL